MNHTKPVLIDRFDHIVLTVASIERCCDFYRRVMGMQVVTFAQGRTALQFGRQKINLHLAGHEYQPHANVPMPGSADVCFITTTPLEQAMAHVRAEGVEIELGPVDRTGATGALRSFYFRDPDLNLIEISNYISDATALP
jgi:catechol 2,3-dioxygenase-like lactoylglutathione lyase family enzyme